MTVKINGRNYFLENRVQACRRINYLFKDSLSIALEEFLQLLTEQYYYVNDENMREGTTHQVSPLSYIPWLGKSDTEIVLWLREHFTKLCFAQMKQLYHKKNNIASHQYMISYAFWGLKMGWNIHSSLPVTLSSSSPKLI